MHATPRDGLRESPRCPACHDASTVSAFVETLSAFVNMRSRAFGYWTCVDGGRPGMGVG